MNNQEIAKQLLGLPIGVPFEGYKKEELDFLEGFLKPSIPDNNVSTEVSVEKMYWDTERSCPIFVLSNGKRMLPKYQPDGTGWTLCWVDELKNTST